MRKLYLLFALLAIGFFSNAQTAFRDLHLTGRPYLDPLPMVSHPNNTNGTFHHSFATHGQLKSMRSLLNSQRIGSAGNLLTVDEPGCNQIDANDSLNAVMFIHRVDNTVIITANIAQYCYDFSKDGGNSWTSNIGPITNNDSIDNISVSGRFPQAVIYNKPGNTIVDSAYLVYSGTWHNSPPSGTSGSWQGQMRGRGKLSGDTSTFNVHIDQINNGAVDIATGMCQGPAGTFWNINQNYTGTFVPNTNQVTVGLIIEKGVWNSTTHDVDWTYQNIPQTFANQDISGSGTYYGSVATAFNIAFDPTGKYGWAACLGNIHANPGSDSVYDPIFWKTTDFGATWTGPLWIDLDSLSGVVANLGTQLAAGQGPTSLNPTTSYEDDLTVDIYGNPHLLVTVGNGTEFAIQDAGYNVYDITYNSTGVSGCNWNGWSAINLAQIWTLRGTFSNDNPPLTEDNRPLISRSPDAHKVFFFWNESDHIFEGDDNNDIPNLFGRAIDVVTGKMTPIYDFTAGDSLWGGQTSTTAGGVFDGSTFPVVGQTCFVHGATYNVPVVLSQIDYNHDPASGLGSDANPAAFWYINNINIPESDFNSSYGVPPVITLNGPDTVSLLVNTSYTEYGATATDCHDGNIPVTIEDAPDTSQVGTYYELYIATDSAGNSDTVTRVVVVGAPPVANFTWLTPVHPYLVEFLDQSSNSPTSWSWNFGNSTGSTAQNPLKTFYADGAYNVCLTATNTFGSSAPVCHAVTITSVGIAEVTFSEHVSLFPNPSGGKVSINFDENTLADFTVSVYNTLGQLVVSPSEYKAGTTNVQMDLSSLANSTYMVKIQSSEGTAIKSLVLTHGK